MRIEQSGTATLAKMKVSLGRRFLPNARTTESLATGVAPGLARTASVLHTLSTHGNEAISAHPPYFSSLASISQDS